MIYCAFFFETTLFWWPLVYMRMTASKIHGVTVGPGVRICSDAFYNKKFSCAVVDFWLGTAKYTLPRGAVAAKTQWSQCAFCEKVGGAPQSTKRKLTNREGKFLSEQQYSVKNYLLSKEKAHQRKVNFYENNLISCVNLQIYCENFMGRKFL